MIITIDGPTGSGKSSTARIVADKIGIYYLNSGALYRALAYLLTTHAGYSTEQLHNPKIEDIIAYLNPQKFRYTYTPEQSERIFFNDEDITTFLNDNPAIGQAASILSTDTNVRNSITELCREIGKEFSLVADGRDMGSVVFPDATAKFYLVASIEVRARRWQEFMKKFGQELSLQQAEEQIVMRDKRDMDRPLAPLVVPEDAIVIDNSDLPQMEVVEKILEQITY